MLYMTLRRCDGLVEQSCWLKLTESTGRAGDAGGWACCMYPTLLPGGAEQGTASGYEHFLLTPLTYGCAKFCDFELSYPTMHSQAMCPIIHMRFH